MRSTTAALTTACVHAATSKDYDNLHEAMRKATFSRAIKANDGHWYHLPTAEYHIAGNYTIGGYVETADHRRP